MVDTSDGTPVPPELAGLEDTLVSSKRRRKVAGAHEGSLEASLVVVSHPDEACIGKRFVVTPANPATIGRSPDVEISFPGVRALSRTQATIDYLDDVFFVVDLGSTNGTFVNGKRIEGRRELHSGDRIDCDQISFKFLQGGDDEHTYHDMIYDLVMKDELTGIFNRRKFEEQLDRDFARAKRHGRPLTLVLFDVDEFKSINDAFGHPFGDHVLTEIAKLCETGLRREEVFSRVGGDEFVILCPEVTAQEARVLAERLRKSVASHDFAMDDKEARVTCSFGVCERSEDMSAPGDLYAASDELLYQSKSQGRDRVTISSTADADQAADES